MGLTPSLLFVEKTVTLTNVFCLENPLTVTSVEFREKQNRLKRRMERDSLCLVQTSTWTGGFGCSEFLNHLQYMNFSLTSLK